MDIASRRPSSYLISLWIDHSAAGMPVWRGVLVTAAGQRLYFSTLAQLHRWLCELAGWQDPTLDGSGAGSSRE
jgi:hypothetical protein